MDGFANFSEALPAGVNEKYKVESYDNEETRKLKGELIDLNQQYERSRMEKMLNLGPDGHPTQKPFSHPALRVGQECGAAGRYTETSIQKTHTISFSDIFDQPTVSVSYECVQLCQTCEGRGTCMGGYDTSCNECDGRGNAEKSDTYGMMRKVYRGCDRCQGTGVWISSANACPSCKGNRLVKRQKTIGIDIRADCFPSKTVFLSRAGHTSPYADDVVGDLIVIIEIDPTTLPNVVQKEKKWLEYVLPISDKERLCGFSHTLELSSQKHLKIATQCRAGLGITYAIDQT